MREQDAGWVTHRSDENPAKEIEHPGVVLRLAGPRAIVIHGTSRERDEPHVRIDPASVAGRSFGLSGATYFYRKSVVVVSDPAKFRAAGRCPPDVFLSLRELIGITTPK